MARWFRPIFRTDALRLRSAIRHYFDSERQPKDLFNAQHVNMRASSWPAPNGEFSCDSPDPDPQKAGHADQYASKYSRTISS
jgi:hypothetical protein